MSKVWHHAFYNELKIAPEEHTVLLSEPPLNPPSKKEKIMELMFEEFTVKSYYSAIGATLGLFSAGKTIGIVVDSGEGGTHTVPVYEGYSCVHAINKLKFAGGEMTSYLRDLLDEELASLRFFRSSRTSSARDIMALMPDLSKTSNFSPIREDSGKLAQSD